MSKLCCYLIPIIVGLISALLGYLLGRSGSKNAENSDYKASLDDCNATNMQLRAQLDALKADINGKSEEIDRLTGLLYTASTVEHLIPFNAELAKGVFGKVIKENDLKIVEGIGPKIEELFHQEGVKTWKQLSETSVEECQRILNVGGDRFDIHNPGTWPRQAQLAYEGKWEELKEWQDILDGGKE